MDLGLSVIWSSKNLGANSPEQDGLFYAWGETKPKKEYSENTYMYSSNNSYWYIGDEISETEYDAAMVNWGNGWRMPTKQELEELFTKCTWEELEYEGKHGYVVTGPNKKSMFIPESGHMDGEYHYGISYLWSSTFHDEPERQRKYNAWNLLLDTDDPKNIKGTNHIYQRRYIGRSIRPVKSK